MSTDLSSRGSRPGASAAVEREAEALPRSRSGRLRLIAIREKCQVSRKKNENKLEGVRIKENSGSC